MTLRELAEHYKFDVETRIETLEAEKGVAVIGCVNADDLDSIEENYDEQIAHWQATLAQINEVLAENPV